MTILDVLTAPWAIAPAKLQEIQAIYAARVHGAGIDIAAVEARLGRPLANEPAPVPYTVTNGVAVLQVSGVMAKRMNMFSQISGGMSMQVAARDLQQAGADPSVHSIIQIFDTPGGTVDGTQAFANVIRQVGRSKPVITLADGTMASAGVWAGTAARQVYIADTTTAVGSIGVVAQHVDLSGQDAQAGVKRTEVFAGEFKRIASDTGPLSAEGLKSMQDSVDYTYSLFVQAVALQRGVSIDQVLQDMADGRMFIGQQAIDAGLVDGIATLDELIVKLNQDRTNGAGSSRTVSLPTRSAPTSIQTTTEGPTMLTAEQVALEHPAITAAFRAEGATAERERIQSIEALGTPGHDALIASLKFDGKSTAGDVAVAILAADKNARTAQAGALANDAPQPLAQTPAPVLATEKTPAQRAAHAQAHATEKGISIVAALKELGYAA